MRVLRYFVKMLAVWCLGCGVGMETPVVVAPDASRLERIAAGELSNYLGKLFTTVTFPVVSELPEAGRYILAGTPQSLAQLDYPLAPNALDTPDSYMVTHVREDGREIGIIAGADPRGVLYGVYGLLEKLGYGFYLSFETEPSVTLKQFDFEKWELSDFPLTHARIVFNWHNFLSGCSTWNLEDWQQWIIQSSKMGFNGIMVHAYGNNPMMTFTHNGETKPVGHLTTSIKGRDWGTSHVNDVRRLFGGKVFRHAVFGAHAAQVQDKDRSTAAVQMMQRVFAIAEDREMDVTFALDVCTEQVNPQNIVRTLPVEARFLNPIFDTWLPDPDTPEGYAYFHSRISALMNTYPQIDRLALWFRGTTAQSGTGSPWRSLQPEFFPDRWKKEYAQAVSDYPELANDPEGPSLFAIGRIARTARRILDEIGRADVTLAAGSWRFKFMPAAHRFFPEDVALMPLDYARQFDAPEVQREFNRISAGRELIPIVWAHHDDHSYITRPYTPFQAFNTLLENSGSKGYGIIHWMSRPLDLYFKSLSQQVWSETRDISLEDFCIGSAADLFADVDTRIFSDYLQQWLEKGPQFGRVTSNFFIVKPLDNTETDILECRKRIDILGQIKRESLTPQVRLRLDYFLALEEFAVEFLETQQRYQDSQELLKKGDVDGARSAIAGCNPGAVLEKWAETIAIGGPSRGELGLLVSMNLRWYPYFIAMRQALRLEPVRYNFQPTSHEALAQSSGKYTWFIDGKGNIWEGLGEDETGAEAVADYGTPAGTITDEITMTGVRFSGELTLRLTAITASKLIPGWYRVSILMPLNQIQRSIKVSLHGGKSPEAQVESMLDLPENPGPGQVSLDVYVDNGEIDCRILCDKGPLVLGGVTITPVTK